MSIKIDKLIIKEKRSLIKEISLNVNDSEILNALIGDKKTYYDLIEIIKGKYKISDSRFFTINDNEILNKQWIKKYVSYIKSGNFFSKFLNPKYIMFFSLLFNINYYEKTRKEYIESKYKYLDFIKNKNRQTSMILHENINNFLSDFIEAKIETENKWLDSFLDQLDIFYDEKISEEMYSNELKNIFKDYFHLIEKRNNLLIKEMFLQSLWDKVYMQLDLRSSCYCENTAKKSKDKHIKKMLPDLTYHEPDLIIKKWLKLIDLKIKLVRRNLNSLWNLIWNRKLLFQKTIHRDNAIDISFKQILQKMSNWLVLAKDLRDEFTRKQEIIIYKSLQDDGDILKGKLIELIHEYHHAVLNDEIIYSDEHKYDERKKELKRNIVAPFVQAWEWVQEMCNKYNINIKNISIDVKGVSSLYIKILMALAMNKNNIIIDNAIGKLSIKDIHDFVNTMNLIKNDIKNISFLVIDQNIKTIIDIKKDIVVINQKKVEIIDPSEYVKVNKNFLDKIVGSDNRIQIYKEDKIIRFNNEKIKYNLNFLNEGKNDLILNPFNLVDIKHYLFKISVTVSSINTFADKNIYIAKSDELKANIVFYHNDLLQINEKIKLTISEKSLIKEIYE